MGKKIYDSLHGFIHFSELERRLIESPPFQRLQYIHQLGCAYLVYPGGTHKRYDHSIGTMHLVSQMFDQVSHSIVHADYWRQIVRMAALCHDLGHLPFSHCAEAQVLPGEGHEEWTAKIIQSDYLLPIWKEIGPEACQQITKIAIGPGHYEGQYSLTEKILTQMITGDLFGGDRIDYLLRDAKFTGLAYGLFDHSFLIENLIINDGMLKMGSEGTESVEALLLARYFMHKRLYEYSSVKVYNFHLSRFITKFFKNQNYLNGIKEYIGVTDCNILEKVLASSDPDAQRLRREAPRYLAIRLEAEIQEKDLTDWVTREGIEPEKVSWDFTARRKGEFQLSFPQLVDGRTDLAVRFVSANWLFLDPEYEEAWRSKKQLTA